MLLTVAFTALAFFVALATEDRIRGLGLALVAWMFFGLVYDGLVLLVIQWFSAYPLQRAVIALSLLNPIDLGRIQLLLGLDISALMGFTGAVFQKFLGSAGGTRRGRRSAGGVLRGTLVAWTQNVPAKRLLNPDHLSGSQALAADGALSALPETRRLLPSYGTPSGAVGAGQHSARLACPIRRLVAVSGLVAVSRFTFVVTVSRISMRIPMVGTPRSRVLSTLILGLALAFAWLPLGPTSLIAQSGPEVVVQTASASEGTDATAPAGLEELISIPYEKFVLDNGLTLIIHEDRKAPIVAVNVWYHVGSKDEKPGRTGFAHLFEHLMFNGSENYDDDYFLPLERVGATDLNGTTNTDRTNYFQNVPRPALDMVLWLESDRMGHLLGAIDQERLDEQRGVVQNEKRQGEDQPYGRAFTLIVENTFPAGHPYSWPVIGHMEDLEAATLDDVHEWFRTYYGAANAVIVIAGDIDPETARERVEHFFGDVEPGPPLPRHQTWVPRMTGEKRLQFEDRVPQARIWKVWNVPQWGSAEADQLAVLARILGQGRASRLHQRLVLEDEVATSVNAFVWAREIAGQFIVDVTVRPGEDLAAAERAIDEELARLLEEGPTADEVERAQTQLRAAFVRGSERIGGFGGKSDILAEHQVYGGAPDFYRVRWERILGATPEELATLGRQWLSDGVFVLEAHPYPEYQAAQAGADRSALPDGGDAPDVSFPTPQRATLDNGLQVLLVERHGVPVVNLQLQVNSGYAADQFGTPGTAGLAMTMLTQGTDRRSTVELTEELERLGATLGAGANVDMATVSMSALSEQLGESLELFADVIRNPAFPEADFAREQRQKLAQIQREKVTPVQMALRVFPRLLYGEDHAYGNPLTGSGTEESVASLEREELTRFHETWFRPNNATLIAVGAVSMDELLPLLEERFGGWEPAEVPQKNLAPVEHRERPAVYLVDRPGSQQSVIFAGHIAPPKANPDEIAIESLNRVLGGAFSSRVNMNLREDKGWSYGALTLLFDTEGQRPFLAYAPVQTDRTVESMAEILSELRGIRGERPPSEEELQKARDLQVLTMAGRWETNAAVASTLAEMVRFGLDEDWYDTLDERLRALDTADLARVAGELIHPDRLIWVVVGDRRRIEDGIRELGLGDIRLIDADGNPVDRAAN